MRPSLPIPQCPRPRWILSRFSSRAAHVQGICLAKLSPNGITRPSNGAPNRLSQGVFPSDMRSWMFRRCGIPWNPPTMFHPDLIATVPQMSLNSAHCSLSNPICFRSVRCWRTMIPGKVLANICPILRNCQCKWLWVSTSAPRTCASSSVFPEKFFFYIGRIVSNVLPKSCTTTAYSWLCRDSHPSPRTLWSAVVKSPQFSALGTTVPVRLLQEALAIWVLKQILQFRSFGKWEKILRLPDTTFARGSESNSWEKLEASRCSGTLSSTRFPLNSFSHSGRSRNGSPRTSLSFLFGFSVSAGPRDESPRTSSLILSLLIDAGCCVGDAV